MVESEINLTEVLNTVEEEQKEEQHIRSDIAIKPKRQRITANSPTAMREQIASYLGQQTMLECTQPSNEILPQETDHVGGVAAVAPVEMIEIV